MFIFVFGGLPFPSACCDGHEAAGVLESVGVLVSHFEGLSEPFRVSGEADIGNTETISYLNSVSARKGVSVWNSVSA